MELLAALKKMINCLEPCVDIYEDVLDLIQLKDPYKSALFLMVASVSIVNYEAAISLSLIGVLLMIQYNAYYRRVYQPQNITIVRNANFILLLMHLVTEAVETIEKFKREILYWGKPARSILAMNMALFGCIGVYITLTFLPLRWIVVVILWVCVLSSSEFFSALCISIVKRLEKIDKKDIKNRA